ncbi:VOC family protein [Nonomuraea harbinensis]|uniref:VOC family protein n=1 Tax=Nonomuraea harbinensis TaxID=1286938 RepID=A0ABW1BRC7_9ACTN|nr:VOC family protein [Nonomuraea harbinensis]
MAGLRDVVVDCAHPASLARFWAAALDGYAVAPYDDAELARLRAQGIDDPEDDPTVLVEGGPPRLWFQRVPERKAGKNRLHLDLQAEDREAEVERLAGLGAAVLDRREEWTVLADPEGNEFCVF